MQSQGIGLITDSKDISEFQTFMERRGIPTVRSGDEVWFRGEGGIAQRAPFYVIGAPSRVEMRRIVKSLDVRGVRFPVARDDKSQAAIVVRRAPYDLSVLSRNWRHNVRRGLKRCEIRPMTFSELAVVGFALERSTRERQGRRLRTSIEEWRRMCLAAEGLSTFGVWGAFVNHDLASFLMFCQMNDVGYLLLQRSSAQYLTAYPNNAIGYAVTKHLFDSEGVALVSYGYRSLKGLDDLDAFKEGMGFGMEHLRFQTALKPLLAPLGWRSVRSTVHAASRVFRGIEGIQKLSGLLGSDVITTI